MSAWPVSILMDTPTRRISFRAPIVATGVLGCTPRGALRPCTPERSGKKRTSDSTSMKMVFPYAVSPLARCRSHVGFDSTEG